MLYNILTLIFLTLVPFLELRASIPFGIFKTNIHWVLVFLICTAANTFLGIGLYLTLDIIVKAATKVGFAKRAYEIYVRKNQQRIKGYLDRYGLLGVAVFIGIPLPGSGVYSAALGAYALGMTFKRFIAATVIGVLIAGIIVTLISLSGIAAFDFFIKKL